MEVFGIFYCVCGVLYIIGCCFEDKELCKNVANWLYKAEPVVKVKEVEKLKPVYVDVGAKLQKVDCKMMVNEMDYYRFGTFAIANAIDKCSNTLLQKVKSLMLVTTSKNPYMGGIGVECSLKVVDPNQENYMFEVWKANGIEAHIGVPDIDRRKFEEEAFQQLQERFRRGF